MKRLTTLLSAISVFIFLGIVFALLVLAPEVDPLRFGISFYAPSGYGVLIGLALILVGVAGILLGIGIWQPGQPGVRAIGILLLILWGASSVIAGIFPVDPVGGAPTQSGSVHNLVGLNFLLITPAVILIDTVHGRPTTSRQWTLGRQWPRWIVLGSAVLLFVFNGPLVILGIGGLLQRFYWLAVCLWLLVRARDLLRSPAHGLTAQI